MDDVMKIDSARVLKYSFVIGEYHEKGNIKLTVL